MSDPSLETANRLDNEHTAPAAERQIPSAGPRHEAPDDLASPRPRVGDRQATSTLVDGHTPDQVDADGSPDQPLVRVAPNPLRLLAFAVDLLLVATAAVPISVAVSGSLLFVLAMLLLVFVVYHTASVWLTGGETIGKAACNLSVRHLDGSAPAHDAAGLVWAFGRASIGYLVVDVFGLGALVALGNPQRRCLHDYALRSQVVSHPRQADPLQPHGRVAAALGRLRRFSEEHETNWEDVKKNYGFLMRLWKWLLELAAGCLAWLLVVQRKWRWLVSKLTGHAVASPPAKALSAGKTGVLVSGTALVTGAGVVVAVVVYLSTSIVGDWGNPRFVRVERVGLDTYQAISTDDSVEPRSGCPFPKGQIDYRLHGRGSHFTGSTLWVQGARGQNCTYAWAPATFDLAKNTLKECSTAPLGDHRYECKTWVRTPKH